MIEIKSTNTDKAKSLRRQQIDQRTKILIDLVSSLIVKINVNDESPDLPIFVEKLLLRVSGTNESIIIISLILMNRLIERDCVSDYGRKIYLVCLIIATKLILEPGFTNGAWARLLKLETSEINSIELIILNRLNYNTHVSIQQFWRFKKSIVEFQHNKKRSLDNFICK